MDGHNSHYTVELLEHARAHGIIILAYPPHTTHALQGHDVVLFAPFKRHWTTAFENWERIHHEKVTKYNFLEVLEQPFNLTFTSKNILSSFRATGIFPWNPDIIDPGRMQPCEPKGIKGDLPVMQSSPVKAMVAAWYSSPAQKPVSDPEASDLAMRRSHVAPYPMSTPIRRARACRGLIRGTSAAFLLQRENITSDDHLPPPVYIPPPSPITTVGNFSKSTPCLLDGIAKENQLLRIRLQEAAIKLDNARATIQKSNVQLVLQHLHNDALKSTLRSKERKPKPDRTQLFPGGKGRHLTSDAFTAEAKALVASRQLSEKKAIERRVVRESRAREVKDEQLKWKAKRCAYDAAMHAHTRICGELRKQGVRVKDLPRKPACPRKKKVAEGENLMSKGGEIQDGETRAAEPFEENFDGILQGIAEETDSD